MQECHKLSEKDIKAIESVLLKGDRAEVVPVKDGEVKILHVRRKLVKTAQKQLN